MNTMSQTPRLIATALLVLVLIVLITGCADLQTARLQSTASISAPPSSDHPAATPYVYTSVCGVPARKR